MEQSMQVVAEIAPTKEQGNGTDIDTFTDEALSARFIAAAARISTMSLYEIEALLLQAAIALRTRNR